MPFEQKKLGRKRIKSVASGIAHMFACSVQQKKLTEAGATVALK